MKRKYYNNKHYFLDKKNKKIILFESFILKLWKIKKITGTTLSVLTNDNPYKSKFELFCDIYSLGLPTLKKKYINVGNVVEPKMIEYLQNLNPKDKIIHYVSKDVQYDLFPNNSIFGGVPDGYSENDKAIIEIKTTSKANENKIKSGQIPKYYIKQAELYCYLSGNTKYKFAYAFIDENEYENPENIVLNTENTYIKEFNFENVEFSKNLLDAEAWYFENIIKKTNTYNFSSSDENSLLMKYLECRNEQEWSRLLEEWKKQGICDLDIQP